MIELKADKILKKNTEKSSEKNRQVKRLQENLAPIRKIAGWTAEDLAELIGVTKQTISNLENGKQNMSLAQYIAIRAMLDDEIEDNTESAEVLSKVLTILLDQDEINDDDYESLKAGVTAVSALSTTGVAATVLTGVIAGIATAIPAIEPIVAGTTTVAVNTKWIKRIKKNMNSKIKKVTIMTANDNSEEKRLCKKCGEELLDEWKKKLCETCYEERKAKIRKGVKIGLTVTGVAVGVAAFIISVINSSNDNEPDTYDVDDYDNDARKDSGDTYEIDESEFWEAMDNQENYCFVEYDREAGVFIENGVKWDGEDEYMVGKDLLNAFIDGDDDIMHARNDILDISYEFIRF